MSGSAHPVDADIDRCARVIAAGGVAVVPTDTLYGLAAGITAPAAVARVAAIKGRAPGTGMPVLLASSEQVAVVGAAVPYLEELGAAFWPGGVTLVIPARSEIDRRIADARGTVAVRVPGMATTREVCRRAGAPITGTSANRHGRPPPTTAAEARAALGDAVDALLDGGPGRRHRFHHRRPHRRPPAHPPRRRRLLGGPAAHCPHHRQRRRPAVMAWPANAREVVKRLARARPGISSRARARLLAGFLAANLVLVLLPAADTHRLGLIEPAAWIEQLDADVEGTLANWYSVVVWGAVAVLAVAYVRCLHSFQKPEVAMGARLAERGAARHARCIRGRLQSEGHARGTHGLG